MSWLAYRLSESDHRLNHVEERYAKREKTIGRYTAEKMAPYDFCDDRLALILKTLRKVETQSAIDGEFTKRCIGVYDRTVEAICPDTATVSGHWAVTEAGLFQYAIWA